MGIWVQSQPFFCPPSAPDPSVLLRDGSPANTEKRQRQALGGWVLELYLSNLV